MVRLILILLLLLAPVASSEEVTIPNSFTNGTLADALEVNANFTAIDVAVDDNAGDIDALQENDAYYVPDDGSLNQDDLHAALTAACTQSGNLHVDCREIVLPAGTFTLTDTFYISDDGNDGPDAATNEGVWGLRIRGAGGAHVQSPLTSAATSRCATTLEWDGASAAPMIWVHGGRGVQISDMCLVLDADQDGTTGTPPASHGIIATATTNEISENVTIRNVDIHGFSGSWANNATHDSVCIALLPSDYAGDPPYGTSIQVDSFVVDRARLQCHGLFLGANGSSGTNGTAFLNVEGKYSGYGLWAESSDLQVYGGKWVTAQGYGGSGAEATSCTNSEAWLKIGSTSSDQAKTVSVVGATIEGNCGEAVMTVDATSGADQRDSTTSMVNTSINWGAASEDHAINYTHHGALEIVGGYFGLRNSEDYTTGSREFISVLPDTRTADTLALRIEGAFLDGWTTGNIQVETNAQVDLLDADDIDLADAYAWSGAHTFVTASTGDNDTSVATTAFVQTELDTVSAASSTDNAIARFDSTAGDVQNSGVTIDDSNNLTVPGSVTAGGSEVPTCIIMRDSDDAGDSACSVLNGTFSCETDTNGVCDDAT